MTYILLNHFFSFKGSDEDSDEGEDRHQDLALPTFGMYFLLFKPWLWKKLLGFRNMQEKLENAVL